MPDHSNTATWRFLVDGEVLIELPSEATLAELGAAYLALSGAAPLAPRESLVLALSPERWFQVECPSEVALRRWLANGPSAPPGDALPLTSARAERCMHSSPAVPGRGYACGWC